MNLTIWNHKEIAAEVVVEINNYYGDNNKFTWKNAGLVPEKVTGTLFRITKVLAANEKISILWH